MRRKVWKLALPLLAVVLVVAAASCSTIHGPHWRKATGDTYLVHFSIPETNPASPELDNQEQWFVDAVADAAAQLDSHPDLGVGFSTTADPICHDNFEEPTQPNCVQMWLTTNQHMTETWGTGVAGIALRYANPSHYFNGPQDTDDPARVEVANDWTGQAEGARELAVCHEMLHMMGLDHAAPVDHDNNPSTPPVQPEGPCVDRTDPHPDKDPDAPYDQQGYDWQNLDVIYDVCHNDASAPGGGTHLADDDDLSSGGYDSCGGFSAFGDGGSSSEAPEPEVTEDTFADIASG